MLVQEIGHRIPDQAWQENDCHNPGKPAALRYAPFPPWLSATQVNRDAQRELRGISRNSAANRSPSKISSSQIACRQIGRSLATNEDC